MARYACPCLAMLLLAWSLLGTGTARIAMSAREGAASTAVLAALARNTEPANVDVAEIANPAVRSYNVKDGLPQNSVTAMAFDQRGYLWIGTQDGAAYYNGRTWTTVVMPNRALSNKISSLIVASDGSIWFGTEGNGVHRLAQDGWTSYDISAGLPHNFVTCLLETRTPDGTTELWAGTQDGLSRLSGNTWTVYRTDRGLPSNSIRSLLQTGKPPDQITIWVGTNNGLARFDRDSGGQFAVEGRVPGVAVPCILATRDERDSEVLWAGTEQGLFVLGPGGVSRFDKTSGLPANDIRSLLETSTESGERSLWVGTYGGGLARYRGGRWRVFTSPATLPNNTIFSLAEFPGMRKTTALWVGLNGGGLVRLDFNSWKSLDTRHGLPNNQIWSVLETRQDDGAQAYWFGTSDGLARLERGQWTVFTTASGLPDNMVICLATTRSRDGTLTVWAGTNNGLARFERGRWTVFDTESGLPHGAVWTVLPTEAEDGSPVLWVGTKNGLARFANGAWERFGTANGLPSNMIVSLIETRASDGTPTLWVGTRGGLGKYHGGLWTAQDTAAGLPNNSVSDLVVFPGADGRRVMWAATGGGIARLDLDDPEAVWRPVAVELPTGMVSKIRADTAGRLYVCTFKGVVRLTSKPPSAETSEEFDAYTFTTEDGLPGDGVNQGAASVDSRGRIWVGTVFGAGFFDPSNEFRDAQPKPLHVERILVNGVDVGSPGPARDQRLPVIPDADTLGSLTLSHNENSMGFEYALLSYYGESATRYRVQLEGFDAQPSNWSTEAKRTYTNLDAGTYTFKVWGMDFAGNMSGPVTVGFSIAPAPWRTWWAYLLYVIAGVLLVSAGSRYHVRSLRRKNLALEAKVEERTHALSSQAEQLRLSEAKAHETEARALDLAEAAVKAREEAIAAREEALQASLAKSVFLSNMSHELRTPLNAILGYTQLLARDKSRNAEEQEDLAIVARSGEHLLSLINDVLSIAKIESGKLTLNAQPFDLRRVLQAVEAMIRLRAETKGIGLAFTIDESVPTMVLGDEGRLRQVLINLLGNAVKFTDEGQVELRARWAGGRASFEVEDTGIGIAADEIGQLFQAFVQTSTGEKKLEGTGLGLVISRQIVQLMGGDIQVRSQAGEGTTFSFEIDLPLSAEETSDVAERRVIGLAPGQKPSRILVAEDVAVNRRLLVKFLSTVGFEVREAQHGEEAVHVWEDWQPDLIWMDLRMPVMDGHEATVRIRELEAEKRAKHGVDPGSPRCTIIGLTASAFEHERAAMVESGCNDVLVKPFREQEIFEKIATHLQVRFLYDESEPREQIETEAPPSDTVERIACLPRDVLDILEAEVTRGSVRGTKRVLDEVADYDRDLALELANLAKNFSFANIEEMIREARRIHASVPADDSSPASEPVALDSGVSGEKVGD